MTTVPHTVLLEKFLGVVLPRPTTHKEKKVRLNHSHHIAQRRIGNLPISVSRPDTRTGSLRRPLEEVHKGYILKHIVSIHRPKTTLQDRLLDVEKYAVALSFISLFMPCTIDNTGSRCLDPVLLTRKLCSSEIVPCLAALAIIVSRKVVTFSKDQKS
jgi:hypothetical protein